MKITAKIGLTNRGVYDATATYDILDFVAHENALYISLKEGNTGNKPTDTGWWQEAIHGRDGITEAEIRQILDGYWSKDELSSIPAAVIDNLK